MIQLQYMAPWVPIFASAVEAELAAKKERPPFTAFQLATVDADGYPHNRTLVYRGFLFDNKTNNVLTFSTDKRMGKYSELEHNDKFEAVFYFEKNKKQFRLRGRARIVDDQYVPALDLATIQPSHIIENNCADSDSDGELGAHPDDSDNSDAGLLLSVALSRLTPSPDTHKPLPPQRRPIAFPIISPGLLRKIQQGSSMVSESFANLHELESLDLVPPTREEWDAEIRRVWNLLSKLLKLSFRGPEPMTDMDAEHQQLIDKILRGVDGKKEENGLKNFAVVGMFVDYVDYYDAAEQRRYIYRKDDSHHWNEHEVCP